MTTLQTSSTSGAAAAPFQYSDIRAAEQIRLFTFIDDGAEDVHEDTWRPRIALETYDIGHEPAYEALSYTWGDPADKETIRCNGHPLSVTRNCLEALRALLLRQRRKHWQLASREHDHTLDVLSRIRSPPAMHTWLSSRTNDSRSLLHPDYSTSHLWIDAISINQENTTERSAQVSIMGSIFTRASCTAVFLGPMDERTTTFMTKMTELISRPAEPARTAVEAYLEELHFSMLPELIADHNALYSRPWFTRTWVVQEALLSKKITVLIGKHEFCWDALELGGQFLHSVNTALRYGRPRSANWPKSLDRLCSDIDRRIHVVFSNPPIGLIVQRGFERAMRALAKSNGKSAISSDTCGSSTAASASILESQLDPLESSRSVPREKRQPPSGPEAFDAQTAAPSDLAPSSNTPSLMSSSLQESSWEPRSSVELYTHGTEQHSVLHIPGSLDPVGLGHTVEGPYGDASKALDLLLETSHLRCRDPKDKIFALRSLFDTTLASMAVDYSKPLRTVFADLSWFSILHGIFFTLEMACVLRMEPDELPSWVVDWTSLASERQRQSTSFARYAMLKRERPLEILIHVKRRGSRGEEIALVGRILNDPILACEHEPRRSVGRNPRDWYCFRTSSGLVGGSVTITQSGDRLCLFEHHWTRFIVRACDTRWLLVGWGWLEKPGQSPDDIESNFIHDADWTIDSNFIHDADWTHDYPDASQTDLQDIWLC